LSAVKEVREKDTTHKILSLWTGKESEWLTYKEIVKKLHDERVSERTIARYLSILVREKKLAKEERGYKKTFYRPYDEFLQTLSLSRDWFRIHEVFLSRIGRDIINKIEKSLLDAGETGKRISKLICEEIEKVSKKKPTLSNEENLEEAIRNVLSREKLKEQELQILVSKVKRFLYNAFYFPLSVPYECAGMVEPYVLVNETENKIRSLLSSYVDLYSFMYEHPGASFEFEKYMRENFPTLFSNE
jgi:hypothetical protein